MWDLLIIVAAGLAAGAINAVVGSGTLVTFPALIALGYPPVVATMSNAIGLVSGGVSGAWGYRAEIAAQKRTVLALVPASAAGALTGSALLLALPEDMFEVVVPVLLVAALCLVLVQPRLQKWVAARRAAASGGAAVSPTLIVAVYLVGVYGGYFAAAQGVLLMGVLGVMLAQDLQMSNGLKNLLVGVVNLLAAVVYTVFAFDRIAWAVVGCIAVGSLVGGWLGAKFGRKLRPGWLRALVVVLGLTALVRILWA